LQTSRALVKGHIGQMCSSCQYTPLRNHLRLPLDLSPTRHRLNPPRLHKKE
jgi:hypothetical protein